MSFHSTPAGEVVAEVPVGLPDLGHRLDLAEIVPIPRMWVPRGQLEHVGLLGLEHRLDLVDSRWWFGSMTCMQSVTNANGITKYMTDTVTSNRTGDVCLCLSICAVLPLAESKHYQKIGCFVVSFLLAVGK